MVSQEDIYEWGSEETLKTLNNPLHIKWAKAAYRWRRKIAKTKQVL